MNNVFGEAVKFSLDGRLGKVISFIGGFVAGIGATKIGKKGIEKIKQQAKDTKKKADELIEEAQKKK